MTIELPAPQLPMLTIKGPFDELLLPLAHTRDTAHAEHAPGLPSSDALHAICKL